MAPSPPHVYPSVASRGGVALDDKCSSFLVSQFKCLYVCGCCNNRCSSNCSNSQTQPHDYLSNDLKHVVKWVENNKSVISVKYDYKCLEEKNCEVLSKDILKMACPSLIHSHINYCGTVWSNAALRDQRRLLITLNKAAKAILGCGFERKLNELQNMMG